jgi:uncharacterized protein YciI
VTRRTLLLYDYVADIVKRRPAHRPAHLEAVTRWTADGRILVAGALGDPPTGAAILFSAEEPGDAEEFAAEDPYVRAGLVTRWRVVPWSIVAGEDRV